MIASPEKVYVILPRKNQANTSEEKININGKIINSEETVQLLGNTLDYKLHLDPLICISCKRAAAQLQALKRLKSDFKEKKLCSESFQISITVL